MAFPSTSATDFEFIHVNDAGAGQKKKNLSLAHSHAMRGIRRARREREQQAQLDASKLAATQDALDVLRWKELAIEAESDLERAASPSSQNSSSFTSSSSSGTEESQMSSSNSSWEDRAENTAAFRDTKSISKCLRPSLDLLYAPALTGTFGAQSSMTSRLLNHCQHAPTGLIHFDELAS